MVTSLNAFVILHLAADILLHPFYYIVTSPYPSIILLHPPTPLKGGNWMLVNYLIGFQHIQIFCSVVKYSQTVLRGIG